MTSAVMPGRKRSWGLSTLAIAMYPTTAPDAVTCAFALAVPPAADAPGVDAAFGSTAAAVDPTGSALFVPSSIGCRRTWTIVPWNRASGYAPTLNCTGDPL